MPPLSNSDGDSPAEYYEHCRFSHVQIPDLVNALHLTDVSVRPSCSGAPPASLAGYLGNC